MAKNSRTHVLPTGQTWDGDCCTEGGVIVAGKIRLH